MSADRKDKLVKARITSRMKAAVLDAAADIASGSREAEAIVLRAALGDYLTAHGYLAESARIAEDPTALAPLPKTAQPVSYVEKLAKKKKRQARTKKSDAA